MLRENFSGRFGFEMMFACLSPFYEEPTVVHNFSFMINTCYLYLLHTIYKLQQEVRWHDFYYYKEPMYDFAFFRVLCALF